MRSQGISLAAALLPAICALPAVAQPKPAPRPNILFILTDDLGYGDIGVFWQNQRRAANRHDEPFHSTPHLDRMAAEGMRFTDHYCPAPVCAPSRASLLLGVHQGHANVRDNQFDKALENNHTLATVLKQAGYATAAIGKYGLQGPENLAPDWPAHPLNRGFDYYYGYMRHADGHEHYPKEGLYRGAKQVWENRKEVSADLDKCYTADLWTARAKEWIIEHNRQTPKQPFFMYLAYDTPHATLELPTRAYPAGGGLRGGLQWLGKPGAMINTAGGKIDSWYHPQYAAATWDNDKDPATPEAPWPDVYKRYATCVRRIDDCVGDLFQLLKDLNIDSNTLVVFTSDNGPSIESYLKEPYAPTFFGSYGPFDGIKRDCWEGGLRVPTIVRWPAAVPKNAVSALPSSSPDWMPTFAEMAGLPAPARSDGVSLLPTLTGKGRQQTPTVYIEYFEGGRTPQFAEFEPAHRGRVRRQMQAVRSGRYVGVRYNIATHADDFEIYDAVADPKEAHNLAGNPKFAALQRQFKDTVLRLRRPGGGVARPYDDVPIPAAEPKTAQPGVHYAVYTGTVPWAPQFDGLTPSTTGESPMPDPAAGPKGRPFSMLITGFLKAPADGEYTLILAADTEALLRIHEATVIDADFGYVAGREISETIRLKAGMHPFRLAYTHRGNGAPMLDLRWKGPGIEAQPIPAAAFSHEPAPAAGASLPQQSGGLNGYISFNVPRPPDAFRSGVSFYAGIWPLLEKPLAGFQIGLPSTWIIPDNTDFDKPLCPPGTIARDNWPERGPYYRDVFQTIEGGLGYWGSTQFGSATPKYRMNGTPDGYNHEISSPGWGFGQTRPLPGDVMGIAQLSNRLLVPPDGLTFKPLTNGDLLGNAWMALPIGDAYRDPGVAEQPPTGDQCWTLFLNAANFKGPVAYWIPETWSRLSKGYPTIDGRGLDARPALMHGGAMEFNTVPYFESTDSSGTVYSRVPKLLFPVNGSGRSVLMQDVTMYSTHALADAVRSWMRGGKAPAGRFNRTAAWLAKGTANPITFRQGPKKAPLAGFESAVRTVVVGSAFCLEWTGSGPAGVFPEYYKQVEEKRVAVPASEIPAETGLAAQTFAPADAGRPYTSPAGDAGPWSHPGPAVGPFKAVLTDGSTVTYSWYRFVDQPAVQNLGLTEAQRAKLQAVVEQMHSRWRANTEYMPPPTSGTLATLDSALLVTPPRGLTVGYVPIVTRQERPPR